MNVNIMLDPLGVTLRPARSLHQQVTPIFPAIPDTYIVAHIFFRLNQINLDMITI